MGVVCFEASRTSGLLVLSVHWVCITLSVYTITWLHLARAGSGLSRSITEMHMQTKYFRPSRSDTLVLLRWHPEVGVPSFPRSSPFRYIHTYVCVVCRTLDGVRRQLAKFRHMNSRTSHSFFELDLLMFPRIRCLVDLTVSTHSLTLASHAAAIMCDNPSFDSDAYQIRNSTNAAPRHKNKC